MNNTKHKNIRIDAPDYCASENNRLYRHLYNVLYTELGISTGDVKIKFPKKHEGVSIIVNPNTSKDEIIMYHWNSVDLLVYFPDDSTPRIRNIALVQKESELDQSSNTSIESIHLDIITLLDFESNSLLDVAEELEARIDEALGYVDGVRPVVAVNWDNDSVRVYLAYDNNKRTERIELFNEDKLFINFRRNIDGMHITIYSNRDVK